MYWRVDPCRAAIPDGVLDGPFWIDRGGVDGTVFQRSPTVTLQIIANGGASFRSYTDFRPTYGLSVECASVGGQPIRRSRPLNRVGQSGNPGSPGNSRVQGTRVVPQFRRPPRRRADEARARDR
jgi:hypothetical protein